MEATDKQAAWIDGVDQARTDVHRVVTDPYWRRPDVRLPADPDVRKAWLLGYSAGMQFAVNDYGIGAQQS